MMHENQQAGPLLYVHPVQALPSKMRQSHSQFQIPVAQFIHTEIEKKQAEFNMYSFILLFTTYSSFFFKMAGLLHEKNVEIPEISTSLNSFDFQFFKGVPVKKKI